MNRAVDIAVLLDKDYREPGEVCIIEVMYQGRVQMMVEVGNDSGSDANPSGKR